MKGKGNKIARKSTKPILVSLLISKTILSISGLRSRRMNKLRAFEGDYTDNHFNDSEYAVVKWKFVC